MDINSFGIRNSTAQYDGFCTGEFGTSVNLFRGEAFFDYPLIRGLPDKNGIGIKVLAAYSSNTDHTARTDNITEPTGVMGLGWQFGYPAIMRADTGQILPPGQEVFYYNNTEGMSRLYQTARQWIIAELDKEVQQEFDKHEVSDTLSGVFAENGIVVTTGSKLYKEAGYYLLEDCVEEIELKIEKNKDGKFDISYNGVFFEPSSFDFSRIVYNTRFEKWIIIQKDGIKKIFGGIGSNSALQYIVHCHGSIMPSMCREEQERAVRQWNLSKEISIWDDEVSYSYIQDTGTAGENGLEYTRACYLSSIIDWAGYKTVMEYGQKQYTDTVKEYADPHHLYSQNPSEEPDCYQSLYETRYLEKIVTYGQNGEEIEQIGFNYDIVQLCGNCKVPGTGAKRLLSSITRQLSSGGKIPPEKFTYITGQDANLGAISTITTAAGTIIKYNYTQKQLPQCSSRSVAIAKEGYTSHKIWNGPGFSAVLLYNNSTSLFRIYGWTGRFQVWTPQEQPFSKTDGPVEAIVLDGAVILYSSSEADNITKVVYYHENPDILGAWTKEAEEVFHTAYCSVSAGSGWVLVSGLDGGEIVRYTYNLLERKTNREVIQGNHGHIYSVVSNGTRYALTGYDTEGATGYKSSFLKFYYLDSFGNWKETESILLPDMEVVFDPVKRKIALSASYSGNICAIASVYKTDNSSFYYNLDIWEVTCKVSEIFHKPYIVNGGKNVWDIPEISWQPVISGQIIITGGTVLLYNGSTIIENDRLSTSTFNFSEGNVFQAVGNGYIIQSQVLDSTSKEVLVQALYYNPEDSINFSIQEPFCISHEYPDKLEENGYIPSICGNTAVYDDTIYCLDEENPFQSPVASIVTNKPSSLVNGGSYIVYTDGSGQACSIRITNGVAGGLSLIDGKLPEVQINSNIFSTEQPLDIILYMDTGDSFNEPVSNYQVAQILSDDGFAITGKTYNYHDKDAVCDSSGRFAKYYVVDVYNEAGNSSGYTRYQYCNSLADVLPSENAYVPYAMDGQLKDTSVYDNSGNVLSETVFNYEIVRCIADSPGSDRTRAIYGAVTVKAMSETCEDGVVSSSVTEYNPYTGETSAVITSSYNIFGDKTTVTKRYYPAAAEYPLLKFQNRLSEKSRTVIEWQRNNGDLQIAEAKAVQFESFLGKKRSIVYGSRELRWTGKGNPYNGELSGNYIEENKTNKIDCYGNILENETSAKIKQIYKYSRDGVYSVGSVTDAISDKEALLMSFESYEEIPEEWKEYITDENCIAGSRSMKLEEGVWTPFIIHHLSKGEYAASFWSTGEAEISLKGQDIKILEETSCKKKEGIYNILRFEILKEEAVRIQFCNNSKKTVFIDIFSISPFGNPPVINIMKDGLIDAVVSSYGDFSRNIYDRRRNIISVYNEKEAPSLSVPFYCRQSCFNNQLNMNTEILIKYTGETVYKKSAGTDEKIIFPWKQDSSKGIAVYMDARGQGKASLVFGNITIVQDNGTWTISDGSTQKQVRGYNGDGEWLLIAEKKLMFFFNGEYVFGTSQYKTPEYMLLSGDMFFTKLLYGQGISFGIRYIDTAGRIRQGQMFDNGKVTVTQSFYDCENRLIAQTKPVVLEDIQFGYIDGFANLDQDTGIMTGVVAEAYPEDEGFPYASQLYEATPVGRKTESGLPGKEYAADPAVKKQDHKTLRIEYKPVKIPGLKLEDGRYHYITTISPDGDRTVSILNSQKQQAAVVALGGDNAIISASDKVYTTYGCVETNYLPSYFEGNLQNIRIKKYNYAGKLIAKSEPCCDGETKYCYTVSGEKRFMQTPQNLQEGSFIYQRYDKMHRIVEEGVCFDPWEKAEAYVDDSTYPSANYTKVCVYEYGDTLKNLTSLSNLCTVKSFKEDGTLEYEEYYEYDNAGRRISREVKIPGIDKTFKDCCEFGWDENIISTTSSDGIKILHSYDAAGRKTKETFPDGRKITEFVYEPNDMLHTAVTDGGITEYKYTSSGWIKQIKSPLMEENIKYNGTRISEFTVKLNIEETGEVPAFVRYVTEYDSFGRLSSALCYDKDKLLEDISIQSVSYDADGNILEMKAGNRLKEYIYHKESGHLLGTGRKDGFSYNADGAVISAKEAGIDNIVYKNGKPVLFRKNGKEISIIYDTSGNRLLKTSTDGTKKVFLYNGNNKLSEKISVQDGKAEQYLYGQFGIRGIVSKDGVKDIYTDHLGSPRIVGKYGTPVAAAQYTPYGKILPLKGDMPAGYNGYGYDDETGIYYSSYRLYDPGIGRFYSIDPKESNETPYVFCGNDPVNRTDPDGDSWWGVLLGVVVGIVGVAASVATLGACIPATLASETVLLAETVVGSVAGAVGSVAGSLVTAACDKQPITGRMIASSLVSGAIGGLGAIAGPLGQTVMRSLMNVGVQSMKIAIAGAVTGCTVGAAAGIGGSLAYSAISGEPVSATSIIIAGLAGMGTGLLATRAAYGLMSKGNTLPVMIRANETNKILAGDRAMGQIIPYHNNNVHVGTVFQNRFQNTKFFSFVTDNQFSSFGIDMLDNNINPFRVNNVAAIGPINNPQNSAVIACHGFGRHCFVAVEYGGKQVYRPVEASVFVNYFATDNRYQAARGATYVKLFICFSGSRPGSTSIAQKFATALNNTVYGTRGITWPCDANQRYLMF